MTEVVMMRPIARVLVTCAALMAVAATSGGAVADSRLFSARTSQPGITVTEAVHDGETLAIAGQGGGITFFRIDNPDGQVPCENQIRFTTSDGQHFDVSSDLCAQNWEVTITVGPPGAGSPGGMGSAGSGSGATAAQDEDDITAPAAPATTPPAPSSGSRTITVRTDSPDLSIDEIFIGGEPAEITGRTGNAVEVALASDSGSIVCERDLGLVLSDGRRIARSVNICVDNGRVFVPVSGSGDAPPAASTGESTVAPGTEVVDDMQWLFSTSGDRARLVFGIPETDASEFVASCTLRSSTVDILLDRSAPEVQPGTPVPVSLAAGDFSKTYTASGTEMSELSGRSHPELQLPTSDPLWPALIKENVLSISIGSRTSYALSLQGSAVQARQFLAACNPPPTVTTQDTVTPGFGAPPPPPPPSGGFGAPLPPAPPPPGGFAGNGFDGPGGTTTNRYACDDGSLLTIAFDRRAGTAVVSEPGGPPVVVLRAPSFEADRWVAGQAELVASGEDITWLRGGYGRNCYPRF